MIKKRKFSKKHIERLSISHKGYVMPEEQKRKISKANKGKKFSKETKKKMSKNNARYWTDKTRSEKTKEKMSIAKKGKIPKNIKLFTENGKSTRFKKGHIPWSKGKKCPQISEALKGHPGHQYWLGKKRSKEDIRKMSEAKKGKKLTEEHIENILKGRRKWYLSGEPTSIEKKLYEELKKRGILFEKQRLINGKFVVDAYIPKLNLVIEADGDYWHNRDDVKKHDKAKNAYLTKCGFNLLRLWETEINDDGFKEKLDERGVL